MTKPKSQLLQDLNRLCEFYERQQDFVGGARKPIPVLFSRKELDRFAIRATGGAESWLYRGFTLTRAPGAK